jgi:hypothetical protein
MICSAALFMATNSPNQKWMIPQCYVSWRTKKLVHGSGILNRVICIHKAVYKYLISTRFWHVGGNILLGIRVKIIPVYRFEPVLKTRVRYIKNTF